MADDWVYRSLEDTMVDLDLGVATTPPINQPASNSTIADNCLDKCRSLQDTMVDTMAEFQLAMAAISFDHLFPDNQTPPEAEQDSPLMNLAAELRLLIWEFTVFEPDGILIPDDADSKPVRKPALLDTCRQIRREASKPYYAINTFRVVIHDEWAHWFGFDRWAGSVDVELRKCITRIEVRSPPV
jgi:hypothetical protein